MTMNPDSGEKTPQRVTRRTVLAATALSASRVLGANDRIRCAIIGSGGRGTYLTQNFVKMGADVVAACDVYEPNLRRGLAAASPGARGYEDYRRLLEDKSIDAVINATPDHQHAPIFIDAVNAGKDAYSEKPLAHTAADGFRMVDAARRNRRVVQVGTQRRSYDLYFEAKKFFDSGAMGEIRLVNCWWLNYWGSLNHSPLKGKLNWDLFLGPAPKRPLDPFRYYNWLQFRDYSGGIMIGQAAHIVDAVVWMMNSAAPLAVTCSAGKRNLDGAENADTACITVEYPENYMLVFTIGYKAMEYAFSSDQLMQFHGSKARFDLGRERYALYPQSLEIDIKPTAGRSAPHTFEPASRAHIGNFLECVRSRKDPHATVEMGNHVNIVMSMAIESLWSGRRVKWNAEMRRIES